MKNYQKINLLLLVLFSIISSCKKDNHEITPIILDNDTHIMFWCSEYISDSIIVECNGQTEKISVYYYSGEPNCSDANNATFDLTAGSYSYTASMGSTEWSGTITVSINECKKVDLSNIAPTTVSNADLIMGSFTGTGNFLPGQIFLGNQSGCTSVPYLSYLQSGLTTLNILKISDNTVSFSFTSNSFSPVLYSAVSIAKMEI
ncbi:MAG: hypothetical protein IPP27_02235 [Bacteroidetes bacterium]|nr:hypothetical protein [Bacteroidota bacterium]